MKDNSESIIAYEIDNKALIPNLTFVVFTYNEERRLPRVIRNFCRYGPLLVVDNYSTDRTVEIARAAGCKVLMNRNKGWVEDEETTRRVQETVKTEYIYWAFADEIISPAVLEDIEKVLLKGNIDIIKIMRKNYFYGRFCNDVAASYQIKVFKKGAIDFRDNTIHHFGNILVSPDRIYEMPDALFTHHFISNNVATYINTMNNYTDIEQSKDINPNRLFIACVKSFIAEMFLRKGYKAGKSGLYLSILTSIYHILKHMKAYESEMDIDKISIEKENETAAQKALEQLANITIPEATVDVA